MLLLNFFFFLASHILNRIFCCFNIKILLTLQLFFSLLISQSILYVKSDKLKAVEKAVYHDEFSFFESIYQKKVTL